MKNTLLNLVMTLSLISPLAQATELCGQIAKLNTCGINGCPVFTLVVGEDADIEKFPLGARSAQVWSFLEQYANNGKQVCLNGELTANEQFVVSSPVKASSQAQFMAMRFELGNSQYCCPVHGENQCGTKLDCDPVKRDPACPDGGHLSCHNGLDPNCSCI